MTHDSTVVRFDEKRIDAIFATLDQCHLPGAAIGIAIGGKPVYRKGFGLASMELPVVLSPTVRMRTISVTKQFTCLAYLVLCEEGKADIDDTIRKHLPELHPVTHQVTAQQLMGNIGGLRDAHDISWQFSGTQRPVSSAELLSLYRETEDVNAAPGTAWIYGNGGFLILSAIIERITGRALEEVLRERIFEPLGLYDTLLRPWDNGFVSNSATSHMTNFEGVFEKSNFFGTQWAGEGGMVSTVDDLLRWLAHMDAPKVGRPESWALMKTPQTLANGTSTGYGLGLFVGAYRGVDTLYHPGGGVGTNAWMLKVPAVGLDLIIMVNREDVSSGALAYQILDACLPNLDPVEKVACGSCVAGVFRSSRTSRVIQLRACASANSRAIENGRQIASIDGRDIPVASDDEGVLRPSGAAGVVVRKLTITLKGDAAKPTSIRVDDFGNLDELFPVPEAHEADLGSIAGRYRSAATHTEATIFTADDGPRLSTMGRFGSAEFRLECLGERVWQIKPKSYMPYVGGILVFDDDHAAFQFSSVRTRALPFRRCA